MAKTIHAGRKRMLQELNIRQTLDLFESGEVSYDEWLWYVKRLAEANASGMHPLSTYRLTNY